MTKSPARLRRPESEKLALAFSAVRSVQDVGQARLRDPVGASDGSGVRRRHRGVQRDPVTGMVGGYAKLLNPASAEDRLFACAPASSPRNGRTWPPASTGSCRRSSPAKSRGASPPACFASGLAAYTQAGRWAFGMEVLAHLTNQVGKGFDELDPRLAGAMKRHGITPADWDAIRARRSRSTGRRLADPEQHRGSGRARSAHAMDPHRNRFRRAGRGSPHPGDHEQRRAQRDVGRRARPLGLLFKTFGISLI
jgi:hypothetical protein